MHIKFLNEISTNDNAGGKGNSLAKLVKSGFNVPPAFVVLSTAFDEFIIENNIKNQIETFLEQINIDDEKCVEDISIKIGNLIEGGKINQTLENKIIESFKKLDTKYVAVRSSATVEDGKEAAWAGQFDTLLNVKEENLLEAIKKIWKSLYGPRALYYAKKNNKIQNVSISVIVQKMINSDFSGVCFSSNPVNSDNNTIVIEAIAGLGEAIVSGSVTPDCYEIDKEDLKITKSVINYQKREQIIENNKIIELSKIIKEIENEYGYPVDVEWAIEDNLIYILQARPITTNKNIHKNTKELLNKIIFKKNWEFLWLREFTWFVENTEVYATLKENQEKYLEFELSTNNRLCINGDEYVLEDDSIEDDKKLNNYLKDKNFLNEFVKKDFKIEEDTKKYIEYMKEKDFSILSDNELLDEFISFNEAYIKSFIPAVIIPEDFVHNKVIQLLEEKGYDNETISRIISESVKCPNHDKIYYNDEPLDLLKISLKKKNNINIDDELDKHIEEYGWIKDPCITENVSFTKDEYLERINTLLDFDIESRINEIYQTRKENDESLDLATHKYNLDKETVNMISVLRDFTFLHTYIAQNTDHLFYTARHSLFKEIEKRVGITDSEIVSLGDKEIIQLLKGEISKDGVLNNINERKKGFAIAWLDGEVSFVFGSDANYIANEVSNRYKIIKDDVSSNETKTVINGFVANQGKVKGIAKILYDYEDIKKVNVGDIIVASMTTPIFVSAMEKAAAFVTDEGGITCHAAIISREFGVPCIVGTVCATKKIKDGDYIEVDAYNGEIRIIK